MKKAVIITISLKKCTLAQKTAVQRTLKGYKDYSNKGSYVYKRKGKLDHIPHKILNKGVFVIGSKDKREIVKVLDQNKADYNILNIMAPTNILH